MLTETYHRRLNRIEPYSEIKRDNDTVVELRAGLYATLFFKHIDPTTTGF